MSDCNAFNVIWYPIAALVVSYILTPFGNNQLYDLTQISVLLYLVQHILVNTFVKFENNIYILSYIYNHII